MGNIFFNVLQWAIPHTYSKVNSLTLLMRPPPQTAAQSEPLRPQYEAELSWIFFKTMQTLMKVKLSKSKHQIFYQ